MNKTILALFALMLFISSCLKDENLKRYTFYTPEYATMQEVQDNVKSKAPQPIENLGNMIVYNNYILAVENAKGIHLIDASTKRAPVKIGFIPIPGCQNMVIRNNYLYANCYTDLFIIDINNIQDIKLVNAKDSMFNNQRYVGGYRIDRDHIIVNWQKKDTMVREEYVTGSRSAASGGFPNGQFFQMAFDAGSGGGNSTSGSMARFTLVNDYLYTVDYGSLTSFSLANPLDPTKSDFQNVGWNIETIYPFKDKLFIGSSTGMYIYNIENKSKPVREGQFSHVSSCDPVIANDNYAFVTLRSGTACEGFTNQMEVLNITNPHAPQLVKTYSYTNPHGLSMSGNTLFLCDGRDGLRVLDASDPMNIKEKKRFKIGQTSDVITIGNTAYVVNENSIKLYDFSGPTNVSLMSTIN